MADAYGLICDMVRDPKNRYEAGNLLLGGERPWGRVGDLRSIFGLE
jgi:hypothetical protein